MLAAKAEAPSLIQERHMGERENWLRKLFSLLILWHRVNILSIKISVCVCTYMSMHIYGHLLFWTVVPFQTKPVWSSTDGVCTLNSSANHCAIFTSVNLTNFNWPKRLILLRLRFQQVIVDSRKPESPNILVSFPRKPLWTSIYQELTYSVFMRLAPSKTHNRHEWADRKEK